MNRRRVPARILTLLAIGALSALPAMTGIPGAGGMATAVAAPPANCPGDWLGTTMNSDPTISADGRFVAFIGFPDENGTRVVLLRDTRRGTTQAITRTDEMSYYAAISDDGNRVAYTFSGDRGPELRMYDRRTGVSTDHGPAEVWVSPDLSADGRLVVFTAVGRNGSLQVYLRDVETRRTTLVSASPTGEEADAYTSNPMISADGRQVLFESSASNLATDGGSANGGLFLRDLRTGRTTAIPDAGSWARLSPDGRYVQYRKDDGLWVYDRVRGTTVAASRPFSEGGAYPITDVSAHGRYVALAGGAYLNGDYFPALVVRDVRSGTERIANIGTNGSLEPEAGSFLGAITPNGRYVAFYSQGTILHPRDRDDTLDVFVRDLRAGRTILVSDTDAGPRCEPRS